MNTIGFYLDRCRFDSIEASSFSGELDEGQLVEMRFEVGFHDEEQPDNTFNVTLKLQLAARKGEEREILLNAAGRGVFIFPEDVEPHPVKEPLERLYAVTLLYGSLRPTLNSIVSNIGLNGLTMPLPLPLGQDGRLPEMEQK